MSRAKSFSILPLIITIFTIFGVQQAQAGLIDEETELKMGRDAAKQVETQYKVSTDASANNLVARIGKKIAAVSSRPKLPWQFKVLETKEVNAFSVPGYVYVNRGLLDFIGNDHNALAAVIGHEIGHTTARHAVRSAEKQLKFGIALQLLLRGNRAQKLGNIAANLALLGYGRKEEYQADKLGVDYMTSAGYDANGMLRFFYKLEKREGGDSGGLSVYFQTHPTTADRIGKVKDEITRLGGTPQPDSAGKTAN